MAAGHVEIHEVRALRVDTSGRVMRLRVLGMADRDEERIQVDVCAADLDRSGTGWVPEDQQASALARVIDPNRTPVMKPYDVGFRDTRYQFRRAYAWSAEIDVLLAPGVPPLVLGLQQAPVHVRAFYIHERTVTAMQRVLELAPVTEFDVGVLLVHGIGMQRRSETLSQWSAPLARWINAWFRGGTDELARQLAGKDLEGWRKSLADAPSPRALDPDYVDRATYANALDRQAHAGAAGTWRAEPKAKKVTAKGIQQAPAASAEARSARDAVASDIRTLGASAAGGAAEFREAYVLDVGERGFQPSSVEMHVEAMAPDGYMLRSRWMLAESHWAESFWAPSFFGFGRWCLLTAPVALVHYVKLTQLQSTGWLRRIAGVFSLCVVVTLLQAAFAALMVLWLVPWERLRRYVLRIQLGLAGIVGDSYVLLQDPVQRRAILDRVDRDLSWLLQRCRQVVVVAHSQGAYVAEQVLDNRDDAAAMKIQSLITLGSGVQTLSSIEKTARNWDINKAGWMAIGSVYAFAIPIALALAGWPGWVAMAAAAAVLVVLALASENASNAHGGRRKLLPRWALTRTWFDFFAAHDIVPYGPLLDPDNTNNLYRPKEVRNRDALSDHVLYWQNPEQIVGPLVRQVAAAAGFRPLTALLPDDVVTLDKLEGARLSRLDMLGAARAVTLAATGLLLYKHWSAWVAIAFWAITWLQAKLGFAIGALPAPGFKVWLQAALVLLPLVVHKTLVNATFDAWTTADVERLLRRGAGGPAAHWAVVFAVLMTLTLLGPVFYVWPIGLWQAVAATALAALVFGWIAPGAHRRRIDAHSRRLDDARKEAQ